MNNVEFLESKGLLGDIRYSMGVDEDDSSLDNKINNMSPLRLTQQFCEFELGDGDWASVIVNFYIGATHNHGE